jgi:hypothetical protein
MVADAGTIFCCYPLFPCYLSPLLYFYDSKRHLILSAKQVPASFATMKLFPCKYSMTQFNVNRKIQGIIENVDARCNTSDLFGRYPVRISVWAHIILSFWWFSSVSTRICRDGTLNYLTTFSFYILSNLLIAITESFGAMSSDTGIFV